MTTITETAPKRRLRLWSVLVWLAVWQALSVYLGNKILLASPLAVVVRLSELILETGFWMSALFSVWRIAAGFLLAVCAGCLFAALASRFRRAEEFFTPVIALLNATPVASVTILALVWVSSRNLSVLISFAMALPVIYTNTLGGIRNTDKQLIEMADIFNIPVARRIRYIYFSQVLPFFRSAASVTLGMCWKAGIAAEVIGIPDGSIGEKLYEAKVYLATPDLFAWTLVVIILSVTFGKVWSLALGRLVKRLERL